MVWQNILPLLIGGHKMMMMFIVGFAFGLIVSSTGLLILLHHQDMKDLENRTGYYAKYNKRVK